jgi:osmotically-inducible protein OsmY
MKSDQEIREDIIEELQLDPRISRPEAIGVAIVNGAVTLTGHVSTYSEKLAAAKAAEYVYGVRGVANEIEVRLTDHKRDDSDIASAIAHILDWNTNVPTGNVKARVENGRVTLEGVVGYAHQRNEVERMVRHVRGVIGITNNIQVRPPATEQNLQARIAEALRRHGELDGRSISVEVNDHNAPLYGHVHAIHELSAARAAAVVAPGIERVGNYLTVLP